MEEKESAISGPYEEFRICFCGKIPSGSVEWYFIDVSVEEACLSEKTESSTREPTRFSVAKHLPSYAALGGLIYSLGGQRRSYGGGETLLNDVWVLDFKSLEDLKPGSIPPPLSLLPSLSSELRVEDREPTGVGDDIAETKLVPGRKPGSGEAQSQKSQKSSSVNLGGQENLGSHDILTGSGEAQSQKSSSENLGGQENQENLGSHDFLTGSGKAQSQKSSLRDLPLRKDITALQLKPLERLEHALELMQLEQRGLEQRLRAKLEQREHRQLELQLRQLKLNYRKLQHERYCLLLPIEIYSYMDVVPAASVEDWKPGLPMNFARYNPHTMVVDHKLYVLGGFQPNQKQDDGWIEVFDPEEKKWESLPGPPDQIHSSIMISGLLKSKKEIIIAKQRWDCHPSLFYSYNITTRCWNELSLPSDSKASVHSNVERAVILPPNIGRAVTVGNTLYWISTEEDNDECTIRAYDLDRNMWFEDHLNTAKIFGRREYFSSIYSRGPGFLHLIDQKFCLLLQSSVKKKDPQLSIEYLYCVILDISPIYDQEDEDWGKFELRTVSTQKYSMDQYIDFLDCMLLDRVSGVKSVDRRGQSTSTNISFQETERRTRAKIR
ncbi:uncharacterized protein LOC115967593 isoform X1 [Quercus lobata]|uniref:uncharacterized protein LOC115967593 isoform X1 n=1 Tax=Quercus lobata TaxID=97700 RepID=UPI0012458B1A|nr:uncharacterized protein LOC115967593 isoform X1 [Quercus lobata]XP_030942577.1 uncharacterized protein LOC115967593 isoform X1 [Quercus lobata]XP_030942578.1 uncharacterized protein LOC115967593 isoform X1 [Quercus lobata]XP_030942579.1 uncharacterized protein LOC115967593 isoform X1 [Quercus lobata]